MLREAKQNPKSEGLPESNSQNEAPELHKIINKLVITNQTQKWFQLI